MAKRKMTIGKLTTWKGEFIYGYFPFYNETYQIDTIAFLIWDKNEPRKDKADMSLLVMDDGVHLKVIDLFMKSYAGRGIAPAIILEAQKLFGKRIISSSNSKKYKTFYSEANWQEAIDRVWEPLRKQGLAEYDDTKDYYILNEQS